MHFIELSLNILTLMGLMLAVGMLVDNSVVVTESIFRYGKCTLTIEKATREGVNEVGIAVIPSTATSVCVLRRSCLPGSRIMVFLRHVGITIFAIAPLIVAQTLIPMLTSRVKTPRR